jgi:PhnB protein
MSKRPPLQPGYSWMSPYLLVKDADASLDFYAKAFGFEKRMSMPGPDGKCMHAEMNWHDVVIMFGTYSEAVEKRWPCRPPKMQGVNCPISLYVYCDDVDALFARAVAAGAKVINPVQDQFYGDRTGVLEDPDGYWWSFATNIADFDPSKTPG